MGYLRPALIAGLNRGVFGIHPFKRQLLDNQPRQQIRKRQTAMRSESLRRLSLRAVTRRDPVDLQSNPFHSGIFRLKYKDPGLIAPGSLLRRASALLRVEERPVRLSGGGPSASLANSSGESRPQDRCTFVDSQEGHHKNRGGKSTDVKNSCRGIWCFARRFQRWS